MLPGTTLRQAVEASGLARDFPEVTGKALDVGVFGRRRDPDAVVQPGDRVEIYRPLLADPKELRRARARVQAARGGSGPGKRRGPA